MKNSHINNFVALLLALLLFNGCSERSKKIYPGGDISYPVKLSNDSYIISLARIPVPYEWRGYPDVSAYRVAILDFDSEVTQVNETDNKLDLKKISGKEDDLSLGIMEHEIIFTNLNDGKKEVTRKGTAYTRDPFLPREAWNELSFSELELLPLSDLLYDIDSIYLKHAKVNENFLLSRTQQINKIFDMDGFRFDGDQLQDIILNGRFGGVSRGDYEKWSIREFRFAPEFSNHIFFANGNHVDKHLIADRDYHVRFIISRQSKYGEDSQHTYVVFIATYRCDDDKYIDSRKILELTSEDFVPGKSQTKFYSVLYLKKSRIEVMTWTLFSDDVPIETVIADNGQFEEFPDISFREDTIAVEGSMNPSLYGKFAPDEVWTLLSFDDNSFATEYTTENLSQDHLGEVTTLLLLPAGQTDFHFDVAFKGRFPENHFEKIEFDPPVYDEEAREIISYLLSGMPEELKDRFSGFNRSVDKIIKYSCSEQDYWFAEIIFKYDESIQRTMLVGMGPDKN